MLAVAKHSEPRFAPQFPGATLEVDACGQILHSWLGAAAPALEPDDDVLAALGIDDASTNAAQVQMLLASTIGSAATAWSFLAGDAPSTLTRRDGQLLAVLWSPVIIDGVIASLAMFVIPTAPPAGEIEDPVEINRICVDALALLDDSQAALRHLGADPGARHSVHRMFRNIHTIKGSTRGPRLQAISDLAHVAEESIELLQDAIEAPRHVLAEIDDCLQRLRAAVTAARPRGEVDDAMTELLGECRPALVDLHIAITRFDNDDREAAAIATRAIERIRVASERARMQALHVQCAAAARAVEQIAWGEALTAARLDEITMLDRQIELYAAVYREVAASDTGPSLLITLGSWMGTRDDRSGSFAALAEVMSQDGVPSLLEAFADPDPLAIRRAMALLVDAPVMFEPGRPRDEATLRFERMQSELLGALAVLAHAAPDAPIGELRAIVQRLAWVPLAGMTRRLARMARTLGSDLGKQVAVEIELGDLVVAPDIARVLGEILIHAIRNAIDHGIESPAERIAAGKDPRGTIYVEAYPLERCVLVTVRDDGRGVAIARVRQIAVERGLRTVASAVDATDAELLDLLFHPGFSTASAVTSISGRGVGMDVIRSLAEERDGSVVLASTPGRGTELTIELPTATS
jgi:two-component system chemotaxis sensor kinase CheA